jgi:hypothetical protein
MFLYAKQTKQQGAGLGFYIISREGEKWSLSLELFSVPGHPFLKQTCNSTNSKTEKN